ncbi:GCAT [Symbiodinium pilosum]|uniref:GCAT protein n=1 Tax=Symbiodinium pilosum TaxID=2952 RepID=A0A812XTE4_SYMPI|nr:GCAT [Symbiodinium pilosum]
MQYAAISKFHGTEDTILFPSCFDANAGLFEACLGPEDAVISDAPCRHGLTFRASPCWICEEQPQKSIWSPPNLEL